MPLAVVMGISIDNDLAIELATCERGGETEKRDHSRKYASLTSGGRKLVHWSTPQQPPSIENESVTAAIRALRLGPMRDPIDASEAAKQDAGGIGRVRIPVIGSR